MFRCPVHDEVFDESEECPRRGKGDDDCDRHRPSVVAAAKAAAAKKEE